MKNNKLWRELWRLRVNGFLSQISMSIVYSICSTDFLTSFHRFVVNPQEEENATEIIGEPGLGQSEFFYSSLLATFNGAAMFSSLLVGILVRYIPFWYQYTVFISTLVIGSILYGIANQSLTLFVSMTIIGLYLGSESALGNNYAIKMSNEYAEVLQLQGRNENDHDKTAVRVRNYLFTAQSLGRSVGFVIGTSIGVLFSQLSIEQYRSTSWFNMACGLVLLIVFVYFFRGESKWKFVRSKNCLTCPSRNTKCKQGKDMPGVLQILIIVSFLLLSFVEGLKWSYFESLLNPILSDSLGLSLKWSSYFYLGLAGPRLLGPILVAFLQKIKCSSQFIRIIGFLLSITGYALLTDWQAISYDPCTEYSPFHHPEQFQSSQTKFGSRFNADNIIFPDISADKEQFQSNQLKVESTFYFNIISTVSGDFDDGKKIDWKINYSLQYTCKKVVRCEYEPIFRVRIDFNSNAKEIKLPILSYQHYQDSVFACSLSKSSSIRDNKPILCLSFVRLGKDWPTISTRNVTIQSFTMLPDDVYTRASNSCMNALDGQCHWIPFSTVTGKKCEDCPPICRGKHQTLSLAQIVIGLSLLLFSYTFELVPLLAMVSNQLPCNKKLLAVVLGAINAVTYSSMSIGPMMTDALYEATQKRTFLVSIVFGCLNVPFFIEVIILYRQLGPSGMPEVEVVYS